MLHPFRGIRYTAKAGAVTDLVTLPYDKIAYEELPALRAKSRHSPIHLIRGEASPDDAGWYAASRARFEEWLREGAIAAESGPAFYVLRQEFRDHTGAARTRTAVIGALDLAQRARVLPHERTHARAREDRYRLLKATGVHYELIFLLKSARAPLDPALIEGRELARVEGLEGAAHRFSVVADPARVAKLEAWFKDGDLVIADGHHRFAVACRYADEEPGAGRVLAGVVDVHDPGLVVLPTHRLLKGIDRGQLARVLGSLRAAPFMPGDAPWETVARAGPGTIGLIGPSGVPSLLWKPEPRDEKPSEALDVARLEREVLRPLLEGREAEDHLSYHRDPRAAYDAVRTGRADLLALVAGIPPAKVVEIASRREIMPQKSTDFYPKLPTGFVFLPAREP